MSAEAIAIVGVGVALLAVFVPLLLTLAAGIRRELGHVRTDVADVRRDLGSLSNRVARVEGALTGPWRAPETEPTASAEA